MGGDTSRIPVRVALFSRTSANHISSRETAETIVLSAMSGFFSRVAGSFFILVLHENTFCLKEKKIPQGCMPITDTGATNRMYSHPVHFFIYFV